MIWIYGCVVLSVCHKVLIYSQFILVFRRVEFLCMVRLVALGFHPFGSYRYMYLKTYAKFTFYTKSQRSLSDKYF